MVVERKKGKGRSIRQDAEKALDALNKQADELTKDTLLGSESNPDGSVTLEFGTGEDEGTYEDLVLDDDAFYGNLVEKLDEFELQRIAGIVLDNVENDENNRKEWLSTIEMGLDLIGVRLEEKNEPFQGACSAQHPLLMESAVKFQSKASNELLPPGGPVKTHILGTITVDKEKQAARIKKFMNYQITEEMTEFYPDTERMLLYVALVGSGFKKTYYDDYLERPCSEFVPGDQFIVPNSSPDLWRATHYTHIIYKDPNCMEADFESGFYCKPEVFSLPGTPVLNEVQKKTHEIMGMQVGINEGAAVYTLYEQYVNLHIPGLPEADEATYEVAFPYIVTVDHATQKVVGLRRNWEESDKKRKRIEIFTHYQFVPSFNFYAYGFLHLLGNLQLSLTSALRALVDAGQFANLQGGFKLKGTRISDDGSPISPGMFKEIETAAQDISKAIMPLPFKEPSNVLFQMLNFLDAKGQKFADSTEQVLSDATNYGPVGTTMALLEASTKFFSAIHKRLHNSLKNELRQIAKINAKYLPEDLLYNQDNDADAITKEDFDSRVDVVPVSDPNMPSASHRMAKAQTLFQFASQSPQLHDMREVMRHIYVNLDYADVDKILPPPEEAQEQDPLADIQTAITGKPIKAFPNQDHNAHIKIKSAFLNDPTSGATPFMQKVSLQLQANIQEHMMMQFTQQVMAMAGEGGDQVDAAEQVTKMNQEKIKAEMEAQKEQQGQDQAALILAQAELMDSQTQARKQAFHEHEAMLDYEHKKERLDLDKSKEMNRMEEAGNKRAAEMDKLITTKGMDAMIEGLRQKNDIKKEVAKAKNAPTEKKGIDKPPKK